MLFTLFIKDLTNDLSLLNSVNVNGETSDGRVSSRIYMEMEKHFCGIVQHYSKVKQLSDD